MMPKARKTFILDTSVLLYSSSSLRSFGNNAVVIPYVALEELDKFKTRNDEVGTNARQVARELNRVRKLGPINEGVPINESGGTLRVELNFHNPEDGLLRVEKNDDRIINVCLGLLRQDEEVVLVTKDVNLSVRADVLGVAAQDFDTDKTVSAVADLYTGTSRVVVPDEFLNDFFAGEDVYPEDVELSFPPNHYFPFKMF